MHEVYIEFEEVRRDLGNFKWFCSPKLCIWIQNVRVLEG